ncbi:MAG: DUF3883 domain-containing protein [Rikenellaceae bacterium]
MKHESDIREQIAQEAKEHLTETIWGKPANDIITGIANNSSVPVNRAIWELIQNARDVSKIGVMAKVSFIREQNEFIFKHNGQPFERKSLQALILQTSSKVRNDIVQIGQYGTGFLTTHKFGLRFKLAGALRLLGNEQCFYNFGVNKAFVIDRSSKDKNELRDCIKEQIDISQGWGAVQTQISETPIDETTFTYLQDHQVERDNVAIAFYESPELVPYVLAFNTLVGSVEFHDQVDNSSALYQRISKKELDSFGDTKMQAVTIEKIKDGSEENLELLLLECSSDGESDEVVVVVPSASVNGALNSHPLLDNHPQLYLHLPLLGTTCWGWNYIIHSASFTCNKDSRDTILIVGNGQNNDDQAVKNHRLIEIAGDRIKDFIEARLDNYSDRKHFGKVNFLREGNGNLTPYYATLQEKWVSYFEDKPLVKSGDNYLNVSEIKVLSRELYEACESDTELLNALYELLSKKEYELLLPERDDLVYWSRCTDEWYIGRDNPHVITLKQICEKVQSTSLVESDVNWLHTLCLYLKNHPCLDIDLRRIVPNEDLKLSQSELVRPIEFADTYKNAMMILIPDEVGKFMHCKFYDISIDAREYGYEDAKKDVTTAITSFKSKHIELKNKILLGEYLDKGSFEDGYLEKDQIEAILDIYKMLLSKDGAGFRSKAFNLLSEFFDYNASTTHVLNKDYFDIRTCYNALIAEALCRFTLLEDKNEWKDWNLAIVEALYNHSDSHNFLRDYLVYRDQRGEYRHASKLKKERNMPERLKDIYDEICFEDNRSQSIDSIREKLISSEYAECFIETGEMDGSELARKMQNPFIEGEVLSIEKNPHQQLYIEIIERFSDEKEGKIWSSLFETINNIKAQLMLSVIDSPRKRESIFHIMKIQDESRLVAIAELTKHEDIEKVIALGKRAYDNEVGQKSDFEFKKRLGLYVETFLLDQLQNILKGEYLTVKVSDEQRGQDLIVRVDDTPIYYIEVKSRWESDRSILMSTMQHQTSYKQKDRYALCAVDMSNYDKELAKTHQYPDLQEMIDRISVVDNIGALNERMQDAVENKEESCVYIAGGYEVLVSQKVIDINKKDFTLFIEHLKDLINRYIKTR